MSRISANDDIIEEIEREDSLDIAHDIPSYHHSPSELRSTRNDYSEHRYIEDDLIMIFLELRDYAERNSLPILNVPRGSVSFVEWVKR